MIEYLQNYGKYTTTGLTVEEKKELEQLRVEVKRYRDKEAQENPTKDPEVLSESSNNESDEGDEKSDADFDKKLAKRQQDKKGMKRVGVSAEVYGDFNKKEDFVARVIPKTEEQINRIKPRILASFLFSALEQKIVDKVKIYIAPKIIGGETSKTPIEGMGIKNLKDAFKINNLSVSTIGEDVLIEGYVEKGDEA